MLLDLQYRESDYLNDTDLFLCYDSPLKKLVITKLYKFNGIWHTVYGLQYRVSSIPVQNCNELYGKEVSLKELDYKGEIQKFQEPLAHLAGSNFGIGWYGGSQIKIHGIASYWCDLRLLNLIINI